MRRPFLIAPAMLAAALALSACQTTTAETAAKAPEAFAGGVLAVDYPTRGAKTIVIHVNPDGSVASVSGGASSVDNMVLTDARLAFSTRATTAWGAMPMTFDLAASPGGYAGQYVIGGSCTKNCTRDGVATWTSGEANVNIPSG